MSDPHSEKSIQDEENATSSKSKQERPPAKTKKQFRKHPNSNQPTRNKRPRFSGPVTDKSTTYQSKPTVNSLMLFPLNQYYKIHTNTIGIEHFCSILHRMLARRDAKLDRAFSSASLIYCANLAITYRLHSLGEQLGYNLFSDVNLALLKRLAAAIILPEPIAKMIESIGVYTLPTGAKVVPYVPTNHQLLNQPQFYSNIRTLLADCDQASFANIDPEAESNFDSYLSPNTVSDYISGTSRGYKSGMLFRRVNFELTEGKPEFVIGYESDYPHFEVRSPMIMEEATAKLGACYMFRDERIKSAWNGDNSNIPSCFTSGRFEPRIFLLEMISQPLDRTSMA